LTPGHGRNHPDWPRWSREIALISQLIRRYTVNKYTFFHQYELTHRAHCE
jgi:hypothetical protein